MTAFGAGSVPRALLLLSSLVVMGAGSAHAQIGARSRLSSTVPGSGSLGAGASWYVTPTGDDGNDCSNPCCPCATINAAIGKASPGDTVYVAVGTYTDDADAVARLDKSLTLSGGWDSAFAAQIGQSALDGEFQRANLTTTNGITAVVEHVSALNGPPFFRGGISNDGTLTLSHSSVDGPFSFQAVANGGTLTLNSTTVRNNSSGYGIDSPGGLVLNDSVVSGNVAGIRGSGSITLNRSLVSANTDLGVESEGGDIRIDRSTIEFNGGGVLNFTGALLVENSTIRGNGRFNFGGIMNLSGNGRIGSTTLVNTTVTGNTSGFLGGGVFNSGALIVNNCTITDNSTNGDGGGLFLNFNPGFSSLSLQNSILAGNRAAPFSASDCGGGGFTTYASGGYNLIGSLQNSPLVPAATDQVGLDPLLGPLQDNGGPTLTHALRPGSGAIDRANPALPGSGPGTCAPADQRGVSRPIGAACDVGAFEAATYLVTNTADFGPGSLRQAILDANANPGLDSIRFLIPGSGSHAISPLSELPPISDPVFIDGFSQPGSSPNTNPFGQATNAVMRIELNGGPGLSGPFTDGFVLMGGSSTLRGLVINRVGRIPVLLVGSDNVIEGNYIGTNVSGTAGASNGFGVEVRAANNRIGGTAAAERNVIAFNNGSGIRVASGADGNHIVGNFIGTNAAGSAALGNQFSGIELDSSDNEVLGNLISGNGRFQGPGITIFGSGNLVGQNYIGTDATGLHALGNNRAGITVGSSKNRIGSGDSGLGNLIAFNRDVFGQSGAGIEVTPPAGVDVTNLISGNSIHSNAGLGIDLRPAGVNPNDPGDDDARPNGGQNYPILTSAEGRPGFITVSGLLESHRNATVRIEFFASPEPDPSGYGEGKSYLGSALVTTNGSGKADFKESLYLPGEFGLRTPRQWISATAIDEAGNSSEFSRCVAWP